MARLSRFALICPLTLSLALLFFLFVPKVYAEGPTFPRPYSQVISSVTSAESGRERVFEYTVAPGDTVSEIASRFSLDIDTLRWSNPELARNPDVLRPGDELVIIPVRGAYHTVQAGDTLQAIARRYNVGMEDVAEFSLNGLTPPYDLVPGQHLIIPGGERRGGLRRPSLSPDSPFAWPLAGVVSQVFGGGHVGLDIAGPYGSAVYAAAAGTVVAAGWQASGYGYSVILSHGNGFQTLYGHLKGPWVSKGQRVRRGQLIGEIGSTGKSTGPHVHFEIRKNGARVNPANYLPTSP